MLRNYYRAIAPLLAAALMGGVLYQASAEQPDAGKLIRNFSFQNEIADATITKIFNTHTGDPEKYINGISQMVLDILYSPEDKSVPSVQKLVFSLKDFDGVAYKAGDATGTNIAMSSRYLARFHAGNPEELGHELKGVITHEITHVFQHVPQGIGSYGENVITRAAVEGVADAVRALAGGFREITPPGHDETYLSGYRTTGFFLVWLVKDKNPEFLKKFNRSIIEVIPWSFDGGVKYALGPKASIDALWLEYIQACKKNTSK